MTPPSLVSLGLELCSPVEELYFGAAAARGARTLHLYSDDPRAEPVPLSYDQLLIRARGAAASLRVKPGQPYLVLVTSELESIAAILGGMLLGALPIPCAPPAGLGGFAGWRARLEETASALDAQLVVVPSGLASLVEGPGLPPIQLASGLALEGPGVPGVEAGLSHLQLTSGSTAAPKGVRIRHANLEANLFHIGWRSGVQADDVVVSWLPLFHDMGLVGCLLFALYWNLDLALLPPTAFLSRPKRWLDVIDRHRGSLSPAPAFAFPYLASRLRKTDLSGLDLSSWRVAYCGAEPIHAASIERFVEVLRPAKFAPGTILPCYGLAEATLAVSFSPVGRGVKTVGLSRAALTEHRVVRSTDPQDTTEVVLLGPLLPEVQVELRDPQGLLTGPDQVGQIALRGPTITPGYQGSAPFAGDGPFPWLATGDLGAWVDGELVVLGRSKDLIIAFGKNHSPVEFERAAESVSGIRPGSTAAFAVPDRASGTEGAVLCCEVRAEESDWSRGAIACLVREGATSRTGVRPHDVRLLEPGSIPRTTSGKVQRAKTRELYLANRLTGAPS
ncbi:MAG: AMP-binding protein [Planctomycetes bacterium]|nr:AMP-binding protein [Planctomycetota bacterium]